MDAETDDTGYLAQARIGSHQAFRQLVAPYQAELQRHCYRMTGSMDDADDIVQETLFRAWRGLGSYTSRGSFRAWLYKIATNRTLDLIKSAPRDREIINSAYEPPWLQPYPHPEAEPGELVAELETIGFAFITALQLLPGRQRAALILRDVLGFSARETSEILKCSVASVNSALYRARSTLAATDTARGPTATTEEQRRVADEFLAAWKAADTGGLVSLLHETVHMTMPPHRLELFGSVAASDFLMDVAPRRNPDKLRFRSIEANGQPGLSIYRRDAQTATYKRHCLLFLEASADSIYKIVGFTEDRIFELLKQPQNLR